MSEHHSVDRRTFMRRGAMGAGALWALSLTELAARARYRRAAIESPYGDPVPTLDQTTGLPLLQLPEGFRYLSYGWNGDLLSDGQTLTPNLHDGMAVVDFWNGNPNFLVLVRNHEGDVGAPYISNRPDITYRQDGFGGTTNLIFDVRRGRFLKAWPTLAGTIRNCAGGVTPWGTWITGEETGVANHGWSFEVGADTSNPAPLVAMGRFSHEAAMVDPATNIVYQTEDNGLSSGFYKFIPNVPGDLAEGGELYMLRVANQSMANLEGSFAHGTTWNVGWVPITNPSAVGQSTFSQGRTQGGARFRRLEGAWWGNNTGFFLATEGGGQTQGQVFEYNPAAETLTLIYDSPTANDLDNPDNLVVTPRGGLLLCEDNATGPAFMVQGRSVERLVGLTPDGEVFTFAMNNVDLAGSYNARVPAGNYQSQEFAGACYSPDGKWLFVNIQTPGITFAITGPWGEGPL